MGTEKCSQAAEKNCFPHPPSPPNTSSALVEQAASNHAPHYTKSQDERQQTLCYFPVKRHHRAGAIAGELSPAICPPNLVGMQLYRDVQLGFQNRVC